MIKLIQCSKRDAASDREAAMTAAGLGAVEVERDWKVYGGGTFSPGAGFEDLLDAYRKGELLGIAGLVVDERHCDLYPAPVREGIGRILQLAPRMYVADEYSKGLMLHFASSAVVGGHPAWLCPPDVVRQSGVVGPSPGSVAELIAAALMQNPILVINLPAAEAWNAADYIGRHPLARLANRLGVPASQIHVPGGKDELLDITYRIPPELVEGEMRAARETIRQMLAAVSPPQTEDDLFGAIFPSATQPVSAPAPRGVITSQDLASPDRPPPSPRMAAAYPRELRIGDPFDPSKHYDEPYFGGGAGLLYTTPTGEKAIYHGPARDWDGFSTIGQAMIDLGFIHHEQ
jgi:hypothetical protein